MHELQIQIGVSQILILIAFMFSFVLAMTAAFVGAPAIGGDLESGVAQAVLARPIRRAEVLAGRWLGCAAIVVAYTVASGLLAIGAAAPGVGLRPAGAAARARVPVRPGARPPDPDPGPRLRAPHDRGRRDRRRRVRAWLDGRRHGRDRERAWHRAARPGRRDKSVAAAERRVVARGDLRARAAAGPVDCRRRGARARQREPLLRRGAAGPGVRRLVGRSGWAWCLGSQPGGSNGGTSSPPTARRTGSRRAGGRPQGRRSA